MSWVTVPGAAPEFVQCDPISPSSVSISWKAPPVELRNGIILGYLITYRLENKIGGDGPLNSANSPNCLTTSGSDIILSKKTGDTEVTISNLETFTSYYVKVSAYTKVGSGVSSEKMICTTAQDGEQIIR